MRSGVISAAMLIAIIVGTAAGGLTGALLGYVLENGILLAVLAGLVGVIAAGWVRNTLIRRRPITGDGDFAIPPILFVFAAVASLAGSLSGYHVLLTTGSPYAWATGAIAGLFSAILMALLVLSYVMTPGPHQSGTARGPR